MPLREFVDTEGRRWEVWQVQPRAIAPAYDGPERRSQRAEGHVPERRSASASRRLLTPELDDGWLCFMSEEDKRRLIPIPREWDQCSEEELEAHCRRARSVAPLPAATPPVPVPEQH